MATVGPLGLRSAASTQSAPPTRRRSADVRRAVSATMVSADAIWRRTSPAVAVGKPPTRTTVSPGASSRRPSLTRASHMPETLRTTAAPPPLAKKSPKPPCASRRKKVSTISQRRSSSLSSGSLPSAPRDSPRLTWVGRAGRAKGWSSFCSMDPAAAIACLPAGGGEAEGVCVSGERRPGPGCLRE